MKLEDLSSAEKILLAEELWDSVAAEENLFPLTADQKEELNKRLADYSLDPDAGDNWENVRNRISKR